jgi:hypothetical protein
MSVVYRQLDLPPLASAPSPTAHAKWFQPLHACGSEFLTCGAVRGTLRQFGRFLPRFSTRISKRISDHRWTWSAGYSVERAFFRVADRSDRAPEPKPAAAVIRPSFLHERTALYTPAHGFRRASPSVTGWVPGRLVERLAFPGALVRCRRWLIMDPGGDLGGQVAQFGGVPGAREITLGVLAGGCWVAREPREQAARDRHPFQRDQPQELRCARGVHSRLTAHRVDGLGGSELRERGLVALAPQPVTRERRCGIARLPIASSGRRSSGTHVIRSGKRSTARDNQCPKEPSWHVCCASRSGQAVQRHSMPTGIGPMNTCSKSAARLSSASWASSTTITTGSRSRPTRRRRPASSSTTGGRPSRAAMTTRGPELAPAASRVLLAALPMLRRASAPASTLPTSG